MAELHEYAVRIARRRTASEPFGWEVVRTADAREVARSLGTFSTRIEALADSARAAALLAFDVDLEPAALTADDLNWSRIKVG
jgi:hypothetical protein